MPLISVIIITKNEAKNIASCLDSIQDFASEIIVLDSGSTDETKVICSDYGVRFFEADWLGFGPQKNRALDLAQGDWVFSIDADERVTPALAVEIQEAVQKDDAVGTPDAYSLPRLSSYCGQFMRHGGWYPDRVVRLFRRGKARFSQDIVHESVQAGGNIGQLQHDLLHISYRSFDDVLDKMNRYSSAGARKAAARGKTGSLLAALVHSRWAFFRAYVLRLGFLDGRLGFVLACSMAHETWYRYIKLWQLQRAGTSPAPGTSSDASQG